MRRSRESNNNKIPVVRLWSYNVFLRPPPIKNNNDDYKTERYNMILERIEEYDIICFQELFQTGSFRFEDMIAYGIKKGFYYWAKSEPVDFWAPTAVDSGLLVLSRFPILEHSFSSFNIGIFSDSYSDKGYIYCKIDIHGSILHLFNLHLQASFLNSDKTSFHKELSLSVRKKQCQLLKQQIQEKMEIEYEDKDLVLLIGDFNINAYCETEIMQNEILIKSFIPEEYEEYEEFVSLMEGKKDGKFLLDKPYVFKDLVYENYGYHPTTYGEEALMVLTHKEEHGLPQCLDYAFQIEDKEKKSSLVPIIETCLIDKCQIEGEPFTQLSDHYGITMQIELSKAEK